MKDKIIFRPKPYPLETPMRRKILQELDMLILRLELESLDKKGSEIVSDVEAKRTLKNEGMKE